MRSIQDELLKFLEWPGTPLHTNASENDLHSIVTKRKISVGTMSRDGRVARDTMHVPMKTCTELGLADEAIPPLAKLVAAKAYAPLPSPTIHSPTSTERLRPL